MVWASGDSLLPLGWDAVWTFDAEETAVCSSHLPALVLEREVRTKGEARAVEDTRSLWATFCACSFSKFLPDVGVIGCDLHVGSLSVVARCLKRFC